MGSAKQEHPPVGELLDSSPRSERGNECSRKRKAPRGTARREPQPRMVDPLAKMARRVRAGRETSATCLSQKRRTRRNSMRSTGASRAMRNARKQDPARSMAEMRNNDGGRGKRRGQPRHPNRATSRGHLAAVPTGPSANWWTWMTNHSCRHATTRGWEMSEVCRGVGR